MPTTPEAAPPRCHALVPCAGRGDRAGPGGPKQYRALAGRSVVAHTLAALGRVPRLASVVVVLSPDDDAFERHVPEFAGTALRAGGASRSASVLGGLRWLATEGVSPQDWVLVHDAARCLVTPADIDRLIDACLDDAIGGVLALPVSDALKHEIAGRVSATLERRGAWLAQTPQMFRIGLLREALECAGDAVTDESSAVEALGHAPKLVSGSPENFKLTWPADFALAERLLATRSDR